MSTSEKKPTEMYLLRRRKLTVIISLAILAAAAALPLVEWFVLSDLVVDGFTQLFAVTLVWSFIVLIFAALNFRNAFYPYIIAADERGIYNYSGLIHGGFIAWSDIERISFGRMHNVADVIDAAYGNLPCITITLNNKREFRSRQNIFKRLVFAFSDGDIKIHTFMAKAKRKDVCEAIYEFSRHYLTEKGTQNGEG